MGDRVGVINACKAVLEETKLFKKIYTEPTDIEKERSFPVAWVSLGAESILNGEISSTNYMRSITLNVDIGTKHYTSDTNMDELIDTIFDILRSQYTLNGAAINVSPVTIQNSGGYFHPYAIATLVFNVVIR